MKIPSKGCTLFAHSSEGILSFSMKVLGFIGDFFEKFPYAEREAEPRDLWVWAKPTTFRYGQSPRPSSAGKTHDLKQMHSCEKRGI